MGKKTKPDPRSVTDVDRQIGIRVRTRRLELGISQETLANEVGVTFQQIQKYEKGVNRIAASTLLDIAVALETRVASLIPQEGSEGSPASALDDPELAVLAARLNAQGRRVLLSLARALADDEQLRTQKKRAD
ncbi:helix-turn-helix domain-containing protein [Terricaulis sp.]|uniref:helix-turn-helix domain-containing protein n=1 Tax=Terricaulis sp. TaxID=2768686 RepID=UPI003783BA84